jgi:hypothetical protein
MSKICAGWIQAVSGLAFGENTMHSKLSTITFIPATAEREAADLAVTLIADTVIYPQTNKIMSRIFDPHRNIPAPYSKPLSFEQRKVLQLLEDALTEGDLGAIQIMFQARLAKDPDLTKRLIEECHQDFGKKLKISYEVILGGSVPFLLFRSNYGTSVLIPQKGRVRAEYRFSAKRTLGDPAPEFIESPETAFRWFSERARAASEVVLCQ